MSDPDALEHDWQVGDHAVVTKLGLVEIAEFGEDGTIWMKDAEGRVSMSPEELSGRIRPPVDAETAREIRERFEMMGRPNEQERPYHRKKAYREVMKNNDLEEMVATLAGIYQHPAPDYPEDRYQERFERAAIAEMAHVLETSTGTLTRELRRAAGRDLDVPDRDDALAAAGDPPDRRGWTSLGTFATEEELTAGESSYYLVDVRPGAWFAWADPADGPDIERMICVHADGVSRLDDLMERRVEMDDDFAIDGASARVMDRLLRDSPEFSRVLGTADPLFDYPGFGPRGAEVHTGGDGSGGLAVAGLAPDGEVVAPQVDVDYVDSVSVHGHVRPNASEIVLVVLELVPR